MARIRYIQREQFVLQVICDILLSVEPPVWLWLRKMENPNRGATTTMVTSKYNTPQSRMKLDETGGVIVPMFQSVTISPHHIQSQGFVGGRSIIPRCSTICRRVKYLEDQGQTISHWHRREPEPRPEQKLPTHRGKHVSSKWRW